MPRSVARPNGALGARAPRAAALLAAGAVLFGARAARADLTPLVSESVRGGLAVDGWAALGDETTRATGAFSVRVPPGATVTKAMLVSLVAKDAGPVPAGPPGFPRIVELDGAVARTLEGAVDAEAGAFGAFVTDVTASVAARVAAAGGAIDLATAERGDASTRNNGARPQIVGHTLAVVFTHPGAPLRNVVVLGGAASAGVVPIALPAPVERACAGFGAFRAPLLSVALGWEWPGCEESGVVRIGGVAVATAAGGNDDSDTPTRAPRCANAGLTADLLTVGSFGAGADQIPIGVEGDVLDGPPAAPRLDDELWTAPAVALADGALATTVEVVGSGDEVVGLVALQSDAKVAAGDADGDGIPDDAEGPCSADADGDGVPDRLDPDTPDAGAPDASPDATDAAAPDAAKDGGPDAAPADAAVTDASPDGSGDADGSPAGPPQPNPVLNPPPDPTLEGGGFDCAAAGPTPHAPSAGAALVLALAGALAAARRRSARARSDRHG